MDTKMVDVTMHLDEALTPTVRESLRDQLLAHAGVMAVDVHDDKPHLLMIEYDPDKTNSSDFLTLASGLGIHAELISL